MKRLSLLAVMILFLLPAQSQNSIPLRFMSYNIRNAIGMDNVCNYQRIADVINNAHPDVIALQEIDSVTLRSHKVDVLNELAKQTKMYHNFAAAIDFDGGKYGIGILSKQKPTRIYSLSLPGREEKRALIIAEFKDYIFCCTHLSLTEDDRIQSLKIIKEEAKKAEKMFFLAGDMNATPDSKYIKELEKTFTILSNTNDNTYPANSPNQTIDYIATYKDDCCFDYKVGESKVINEPMASDHRPLFVNISIQPYTGKIFSMSPYLQNPTNNGITVMWQTSVPTNSWVEYGTDINHLQKVHSTIDGQVLCNNKDHKIRINNLKPGQKYYYKICSTEIITYQAYKKVFGGTAASGLYSFTLPQKGKTDFTAIIFNDLHKHSNTFKVLCQQIKDIKYDFVIFNGDCIDDPENKEQASNFLNVLNMGVGAQNIPAFYLRGNHEIRNAYSMELRNLFDYVGDKTYGAFSWGDTRFVMLDCGEDKVDSHPVYYGLNDFSDLREQQVKFLNKELSTNEFKNANKRVLLHHIPLYGNDYENLCFTKWHPILSKAPFNISINAHTHQFAYHPKGSLGNHYPVIIGGGYDLDNATVIIIQKKGNDMKVKVMNAKGEFIH